MKINDYFLSFLAEEIKKHPHGTKADLAKKAGISSQTFNKSLKWDREFTEDERRSIAQHLGYSYEKSLNIGRENLGCKIETGDDDTNINDKYPLQNELELLRENRKLRIRIEELEDKLKEQSESEDAEAAIKTRPMKKAKTA